MFYVLVLEASTSVVRWAPIFFVLERKARLASERSGEACAGLERKSKKNRTAEGGGRFLAFIFMLPVSVFPLPSWVGDLLGKLERGFGCPWPDAGARCCNAQTTS